MNTNIIYIFDLIGVSVFAISGALIAGKKQMDLFGVLVLAGVTAIGGGTIRDLLLGKGSVFWVNDTNYLIVIIISGILTVIVSRKFSIPGNLLLIADACGLSLFTVLGAAKALSYETSYLIAIVMGVVTGVAGGIIRDLLCSEVPLILRKDIYATSAVLGASVFIFLLMLDIDFTISIFSGLISCLILRLAAIRWHLSLPVFKLKDN